MTYGLVMIVKDETAVIEACLKSAKPFISAWTICDTGSTDGTPDKIAELLAGVPGQVYFDPWVNFGHNRSLAFARARGTADWLLALDADMTVEIDPDFEPSAAFGAYSVRMGTDAFSYRLPLVLRGDLPFKSVGAVHEYTCLEDGKSPLTMPTDGIRVHYDDNIRRSPEKYQWHAKLLEDELERNPTNARATFYLAETYRTLEQLDKAREFYYRRSTMEGFDQETFYAYFQASMLEPDWPTKLVRLMSAWEMRPARLEPLYAMLIELNRHGYHNLSYKLSDVPLTRSTDTLFVHEGVWDWGMKFERSIACWWMQDYETFEKLSEDVLANPRVPADIRDAVIRNRDLPRGATSAA